MASGKKKADVVAAQRTAATTTGSPSSRCASTTATVAATTPPPSSNANHNNANNNNNGNNNYAAPHTPIASAKRPRDRRRQSSRSSRLTPKRSSSSCSDGKENRNGAGNDHGRNGGVENEGDDRCSAAGANAGASSSASSAPSVPTLSSSSSSPMSPMHPARPTPRDCHHVASHPPHPSHRQRSRDDDNGAAAALSATAEEKEDEGASGSGGGGGSHHERTRSWVGSKVDAIFSPVLNFLHGPTSTNAAAASDSEGEDRRRLRQREPPAACDSEGSVGGNGAERKVTEETVDVLDEDGDVSMAEPEEEADLECREDLRREQRAPAAVYEGHVRSTQTTTYTATTTMTNGGGAVTSATATTDTTTTVIRKSSDVSAASSSAASSHLGMREAAAAAIEDARLAMDKYLQEDLDVERSDVDDDGSDEGAYCRRGHYPTQHRRQRPHHRQQQQQQHVEESSSEEEEEEVEDQELEESIDVDEDEEDCEDEEEEEEFNPYLFIKSLPHYSCVVPHPTAKICLPPKHPRSPPISLVLDLDETLVHCTVEPTPDADMVFPVVFNDVEYRVHVRTRPYLKEFLEMVRNKFEVIVFTASQRVYADELLDRIDPGKKYIKHRMFRESCLPVEGNYLKDLNVLGRDLSKSVLVDNSPHAFGYQVDNGIPIESWFDDPNDTELLKLERFLRTLHDVEDVRDAVRDRFQTFRLIMEA